MRICSKEKQNMAIDSIDVKAGDKIEEHHHEPGDRSLGSNFNHWRSSLKLMWVSKFLFAVIIISLFLKVAENDDKAFVTFLHQSQNTLLRARTLFKLPGNPVELSANQIKANNKVS